MVRRAVARDVLTEDQIVLLLRLRDACGPVPSSGIRGADAIRLMTDDHVQCRQAMLEITDSGRAFLRVRSGPTLASEPPVAA